MNSILVRCRRLSALVASLFVLLVCLVAAASAQDIAVTKTTDNAIVAANSDVIYQVTVSNSTESTGSTTLTDAVPPNMTFVSADIPVGWDCGVLPTPGSGGTITCTYAANLPESSAFFFTFVFHVVPGTPNGTEIINTASITNEADNNSSNNSSPIKVTVGEPPPPPPESTLATHDVLISEFRLSGPNGSNDEYVELYCNRNTDCDLSGAQLRTFVPGMPGTEITFTFPGQTIIPARHFLLVGNVSGYSLFGYGSIDFLLSTDIVDNEGVQLTAVGAEPIIIDSVGFIDGNYIEGTGLERATSRPADQYAYVRKRTLATNGLPQDTDDNADDFVLVSVTGAPHAGITAPPVLGAPGPKGLTSPRSYTKVQMPDSLVDQTKSKEADPNRVRVGSGNSGTLSIRRSLFNNTGNTLDYLSFRVIEIPTLNSPITLLSPQAELRLISSSDTTALVPSRQVPPVLIYGTHLEYDDICGCPEPRQPEGGGLNSTVSIFNEGSIAANDVVDVQWLFEVRKAGSYRVYVYVEAGFPRGSEVGASDPNAPRIRSTPTTPREFAETTRGPLAVRKPKVPTPVVIPVRAPTTNANLRTGPPARVSTTPRFVIINRGMAEGEKKPRKKTRVRRKNSAALKKKAEEKFAAEKPQN